MDILRLSKAHLGRIPDSTTEAVGSGFLLADFVATTVPTPAL